MNSLDSSVVSHFDSAVICMCACAIPVTWHWLRVKGYYDTEIFGDSVQNVPGHPEVVPHGDALTGAHLELPLKQKIQNMIILVHLTVLVNNSIDVSSAFAN